MLREKDLTTQELVRLGRGLKTVCRDAGVTFLVNHDCEAASELAADGVHLGYRSVSVERARAILHARSILGEALLVGCSTHDRDELRAAIRAGADYVTYGPIHDTPSKSGLLTARGMGGLRTATEFARESAEGLPVVALGGLTPADVGAAREAGAAGVAAIRALVAANDPEAAAGAFALQWGTPS